MPYVARAAVKLSESGSDSSVHEWHVCDSEDDLKCKWRVLRSGIFEVISGVYNDRYEALACAKNLYVQLIYKLMLKHYSIADGGCTLYETRLYNGHLDYPLTAEAFIDREEFFFWSKQWRGGTCGPGVYEVESSIDEFDEYAFLWETLTACRDFEIGISPNIAAPFQYSRQSQPLLNDLISADSAPSYELGITLFTCIIEHLAETQEKPAPALEAIDKLMNYAQTLDLEEEEIRKIRSYIGNAKYESSRGKCQRVARAYAQEKYHGIETKTIVSEAYSVRSAFSHGSSVECSKYPHAHLIKLVALDAVAGFLRSQS